MRAGAPGGRGRSMNQIRADQRLSFVRPRKKQRIVSVAAAPQAVDIDLATTALLVVDMQNDFCHPNGWFAAKGIDASPIAAVVPTIERMTSATRAAGIPVLWLNWGVRPDRANLPHLTLAKGRAGGTPTYGDHSPSGRGRILVRDDWGAAIIDDLTVDASDIGVHKHRISGFWDNELDSMLRQRGITTLLFAGIDIDRCVFFHSAGCELPRLRLRPGGGRLRDRLSRFRARCGDLPRAPASRRRGKKRRPSFGDRKAGSGAPSPRTTRAMTGVRQ
jgi:ureidoacrylate peracid hydrolase